MRAQLARRAILVPLVRLVQKVTKVSQASKEIRAPQVRRVIWAQWAPPARWEKSYPRAQTLLRLSRYRVWETARASVAGAKPIAGPSGAALAALSLVLLRPASSRCEPSDCLALGHARRRYLRVVEPRMPRDARGGLSLSTLLRAAKVIGKFYALYLTNSIDCCGRMYVGTFLVRLHFV